MRRPAEYVNDPNLGPALTDDVFGFPTAAQARAFIDSSGDAVRACPQFSQTTDSGETDTARMAPLALARLGDQSMSLRETISHPIEVAGGQAVDVNTGNVDLVYVPSGNVVTVVGYVSRDVGVSNLRKFASRALRRVETVRRATAKPGSATTAPAVDTVAACRAVVAGLPTAPPDPAGIQDPIAQIRENRSTAIPLETERPQVVGINAYLTPDMYLDGTPVPDRALWRDAMVADGFVDAIAIGYANSKAWHYGTEAFQFGSPAMAADFQRRTLDAACAGRHATRMSTIDGYPNAVVYESTDSGVSPYRANFVIGRYVVQKNVCGCIGQSDPLEAVRMWAMSASGSIGVTPS